MTLTIGSGHNLAIMPNRLYLKDGFSFCVSKEKPVQMCLPFAFFLTASRGMQKKPSCI